MNHRRATVTRPTATACASLAEHLRDGPLKTIAELQARAAALPHAVGADGAAELAELVFLAQTAMAQFRELTRELETLVGALATPPPDER